MRRDKRIRSHLPASERRTVPRQGLVAIEAMGERSKLLFLHYEIVIMELQRFFTSRMRLVTPVLSTLRLEAKAAVVVSKGLLDWYHSRVRE
jgi:hypothetical protein